MSGKIKNIEKAAERIRMAAANKERIILYGDSDLDGVSSVVITEEAVKSLGGNVCAVFFPSREADGYGINLKALDELKQFAPALFITMDLGIGNNKEVKEAKKMGFEVIVVDHHEPLDSVPEADIVVDPKQKEDNYPFKDLANVGIAFKLCEEILGDNFSEGLKQGFLELTALATIADMVPQVEDNKVFIEKGLRSLPNTFRPGLRAFLDIFGTGEVVAEGAAKIISCLNAAESFGGKNESYLLLTCFDDRECGDLAESLAAKLKLKQQGIKEIVAETERRILQKPDSPIVFEGDPAWRLTLAGSVASIISQKTGKPTFIFKKGDDDSCGSVRVAKEGDNSIEAMNSCKELLLAYGGHIKASGFRIKTKNLEKFKECLSIFFKKTNL